jgi:hypothetical protein
VITVDKNVPVAPSGTGRRGQPPKYPWRQLVEPGDSFFVPGATRSNFTAGVHSAGEALGVRFIARETIEDVGGETTPGVRVWRAE